MLLEHRLKKGNAEGLVFADPDGNPRDPRAFAKYEFKPTVKEAGIGKARFHDLRHTFGSLKIDQGENVFYVSK